MILEEFMAKKMEKEKFPRAQNTAEYLLSQLNAEDERLKGLKMLVREVEEKLNSMER